MASNFESSIKRGSDLFHDYFCFPCQENDGNAGAEFYCEECLKFFCGKCVDLHNTLFKKHAALGKGNIRQWPGSKLDAHEHCQEHKKEVTGFCEDHTELICHACHVDNHQKCSHVVLIAANVKVLTGDPNVWCLQQKGGFKQASKYIQMVDQTRRLRMIQEIYQTSVVNQPVLTGDPNQVIRVRSSKKYSVKTDRDPCISNISDICETSKGELLITDKSNFWVKLLDQTYTVVAICDLPASPWSMCSIDSSRVAVTGSGHEVHFILVTNRQLKINRTLKLQHACLGIAHHQGNLYITDNRALYHYTVGGTLVSKMYEDTSEDCTVGSCAVSPDGERIYVTNQSRKQLVTLSRDGTVISTLTDKAMDWRFLPVMPGLHVTDSGQVLVCGVYSDIIIQVDRDGKQRLAQVVSKSHGVTEPRSVYYSKCRGTLIVGMEDNNFIMVFDN